MQAALLPHLAFSRPWSHPNSLFHRDTENLFPAWEIRLGVPRLNRLGKRSLLVWYRLSLRGVKYCFVDTQVSVQSENQQPVEQEIVA